VSGRLRIRGDTLALASRGRGGLRILFTTPWVGPERPVYDYIGANCRLERRATLLRNCSFGLRFLRMNLPEIEILEYPSEARWRERLREGWDVVGFSFYANDIPAVLRMAEEARRAGVRELWAGNYGALTPQVQGAFDRVFRGYAEGALAKALGRCLGRLLHPPVVGHIGTRSGLKIKHFGYVFTTRGCSVGCSFCQTPAFSPLVHGVPIESIEEVVRFYRRIGIRGILVLDENFGLLKRHAEQAIEVFERYGMHWGAMLRADFLLPRVDAWKRRGFFGGLMGIESLNPARLRSIHKRENVEVVREAFAALRRNRMLSVGYYMLGFEDDTAESIRADVEVLRDFELDLAQVCVITPLPATPLWDEIHEKWGICDRDWSHWDAKHLVWNHPHITPGTMRGLLNEAFDALNTQNTTRRLLGLYRAAGAEQDGAAHYLRHLVRANRFEYAADLIEPYRRFLGELHDPPGARAPLAGARHG
jgi:radical SAM superfamily enzyme YgiQ (UPF0313 family)